MATSTGTTSSAGSFSAESEALKLAYSYLANSMDATSLLPAALSRGLIREQQKADCTSETNPYQKAEKFLDHLQREVNGDSSKFHTFVQLLVDKGYSNLASRLLDKLSHVTSGLMETAPVVTKSSTEEDSQEEHVVDVSDTLLQELVTLRIAYADFLERYKRELYIESSPKAQKELVGTLERLVHRGLGSDCTFQSCFDTLVDEEVSLFNVTYLKQICNIFPQDIRASTEQFVVKYEEQLLHFMNGTTLEQFKKLFPTSAVSSKLSSQKAVITLKLKNYWGTNTVEELRKLVALFGIPGSRLHLERIGDGSVIVQFLCSTIDAKELKGAIIEVTDSLQSKGVLQIFVGEELVLETFQSNQQVLSHQLIMVISLRDSLAGLRSENQELRGVALVGGNKPPTY